MILKIDYETVKLQKVIYDVLWRHKDYVTANTSSKWRHLFSLSSPALSKILVALLKMM